MATPHKLLGRLALAAVLAAATPALAGKRDQSVKFAYDQAPENVDPFFNNVRIGVIIGQHVWDTLIYRDPNSGEYKGQLATAWRQVDDKTLEFDLRQGVKFHNGEEFDADDVVYTLNFVSKPENKVVTQSNVNWIDRAEKIDKYKVRICHQERLPGRDRVSRRPGRDPSERVLREGRAEGPEREAGRLRSVPGDAARARQVDHARAQPGLLQGLAEGPAEDRRRSRSASSPTVRRRSPRCCPAASTSSCTCRRTRPTRSRPCRTCRSVSGETMRIVFLQMNAQESSPFADAEGPCASARRSTTRSTASAW